MTTQDRTPPRGPGRLVLVDVDNGSYRELAPERGEPSSQIGFEPPHDPPHDPRRELSFGAVPGGAVPGTGPTPGRASSPATRPDPVPHGSDPWQIAHDWPEHWRAYLHAHFRNHMVVARVFDVSEPAARKWWNGVGSCRGDKTAIAMDLHPRTAAQMLYGLAAE